MRITKTFEIEGIDKTFTIHELKIKQIISLMSEENLDTDLDVMKEKLDKVFLPMCSNIELSELIDMAPSEVEIIWNNFKEANKSFFDLAQKMGLENLLMDLKQAITADFSNLLANSSRPAIPES